MKEIRGTFDARGRRFAVAASAFNEVVVSELVDGAVACSLRRGRVRGRGDPR
jgi:6,7-dimethyl-8-ribityllumazine synthase